MVIFSGVHEDIKKMTLIVYVITFLKSMSQKKTEICFVTMRAYVPIVKVTLNTYESKWATAVFFSCFLSSYKNTPTESCNFISSWSFTMKSYLAFTLLFSIVSIEAFRLPGLAEFRNTNKYPTFEVGKLFSSIRNHMESNQVFESENRRIDEGKSITHLISGIFPLRIFWIYS